MMPNYNPYLQGTYQPYAPTSAQYAPTQQINTPTPSIVWVQGEGGAKSYLVAAGQSVLLMDSESSTFYIKSTDASGMPMPLRVFEYKEKTNAPKVSYVTHEEFEKWVDEITKKLNVQEGA